MDLQKATLAQIYEFSAHKLAEIYKPGRVAHLAIDWQKLYCDTNLPINRGIDPAHARLIETTQASAGDFAQALRPQVASVWVYHDPVLSVADLPEDYFQHSKPCTRARKLDEMRAEGLKICGPVDPENDLLVRKPDRDAFADTSLHEQLQARGVETLLVTGLFRHFSYNKRRSECVGQTVASALERGYHTFIVEDLTVNKMVDTDATKCAAVRMTTGEKAYGVAARDVLRLIKR